LLRQFLLFPGSMLLDHILALLIVLKDA